MNIQNVSSQLDCLEFRQYKGDIVNYVKLWSLQYEILLNLISPY